jgi:copper chaperone CopZ
MQTIRVAALTGMIVALAAATSQAQVEVSGVHLCCGMCAKAIGETLGGVDGVSNASCDRDAKKVTFTASGEKATKAGLAALSKAGFYGAVKAGNANLTIPIDKVAKDASSDEIVFYGVHLCCGACVKAVGEALKDLGEPSCDREARTVTLKGSDISVAKALATLNKAGFNGSLTKPEEKKEDK